MIKDWSLDRFPKPNQKLEKPFYEIPDYTKTSWTLAYNYLFKNGEALIRKSKNVIICRKKNIRIL